MNHTECQDAIALDDVEEITLAHLEQCEACQSFADDMRRLEQLAVELAPAPPSGLADRVLAAVTHESPRGATVVPLRRSAWRAAAQSRSVRFTSAAAVLVLIAAVATSLVQNRTQDPADMVLASAESTAAAGTAQLRVSARTEVVLHAPPPAEPGRLPAAPNFASAPVELRGQLETQWNEALARFEAQLRDFFVEVDRSLDTGTRQMDEALRQMERQFEESLRQFGGEPGRRPSSPRPQPPHPEPRAPAAPPPAGHEPQPPPPPAQVSARVDVTAVGNVDFDQQRIALKGAVRSGQGRAPFLLAATGDAAVYRSGARDWIRLPGRAGPVGTVVLDPQAIVHIARSATDVRADGTAMVEGEVYDRYAFTIDGSAMGDVHGGETWVAQALVDPDGRLRRVALTSGGPGEDKDAQVRTHLTMELSGLGGAGATGPLPAATGSTPLPGRSSLPLYPFNTSVRAAQQRGNR